MTGAPAGEGPGRAGRRLRQRVYDGLFLLFLVLSSPWFLFRFLREPALWATLGGRFGRGPARRGDGPCVWVHGVSVGEVKAAASLIRDLQQARPDLEVVLSSTTPSGLTLARHAYPDLLVVQFPLDLSWVVRRMFRRLRPSAIVLLELEIWPNLVAQADRQGIPVLVINGRISARSFRGYRRFRSLVPEFDLIDRYSVQTEDYAERLRRLHVDPGRIEVSGNLKYDSLALEADEAAMARCRVTFGLEEDARVLVAGSTHPGEEEVLLAAFGRLREAVPGLRLVLAPRHVERSGDVVRQVTRQGYRPATLTGCREEGAAPPADAILLVDTIGELEAFYGLAEVVFVGGSLVPRGGHNILEPAGLGRPVVFGPHMDNFQEEARLLLEQDAGVQVADAPGLGRTLEELLLAPHEARLLGDRARAAVASRRGTTRRTLDQILARLDPSPSNRRT